MKISLIIATKDRPKSLQICLDSILSGVKKPDEIIIVDQSRHHPKITRSKIPTNNSIDIKICHPKQIGASFARNIGSQLAGGKIIAFIDDDCTVDKNWISQISRIFSNRNEVKGVFGQVLPYRPQDNLGLQCPSIANQKINKPIYLDLKTIKKWGWFSSSSNMALRKEIALKYPFSLVLGPGALIRGSEDFELCYRLLRNQELILYDPRLIIYHHKWVTNIELGRVHAFNDLGFVMFHFYYLLQGDRFALENLIMQTFKTMKRQGQYIFDSLVHHHPRVFIWEIVMVFKFLFSWSLGIIFGIFYWLYKKISLNLIKRKPDHAELF